MILVVDNYDSFTYNLAQALGDLGAELRVVRNDEVDAAEVASMEPTGVVMSPGPGRPEDAGCCCEVVEALGDAIPMLGVCLGHQALAVAFGGSVVRAPAVVHGKTALVHHDGDGLFEGLPEPFEAARYHSLVVERQGLPDVFEVCAWTENGLIMAMRHRERPLQGVQFHPESIATPDGPRLLRNFLVGCEEIGADGSRRDGPAAARSGSDGDEAGGGSSC